ncbi:MAG: hypothetical protein KIT84_35450 [Labilithrix sp.]|nr:hypothetical protein [Labilithrix sp.]MCW5816348.1 hypothetical protein [Labilithrix sp.]
MNLELDVLRAFLRLARRRSQPTIEQLVVRVGADEAAVRDAVKLLLRQGLLQRNTHGVGLTLAGLAIGVAIAKRPATRVASTASSAAPGVASAASSASPRVAAAPSPAPRLARAPKTKTERRAA